jgi:hypothetical protein
MDLPVFDRVAEWPSLAMGVWFVLFLADSFASQQHPACNGAADQSSASHLQALCLCVNTQICFQGYAPQTLLYLN